MADRLSKHYGDGRLDEEEFNKRLDQAMKAKTQSDLAGLFTDLPGPEVHSGPQLPQRQQRGRYHLHRLRRIAFLAVVILVTAAIAHSLAESFVPWLLLGILAVLWLRGPTRHRRR